MFTHWENSGILITLELTQPLIADIVSENYTIEQVNLDVIYLINNFPSVQAGINNNGKRFAIESDPLYINF